MISVYYTSCMKNIMAHKLAIVSIKAISNFKKIYTRYKSSVSYTIRQSYIITHIINTRKNKPLEL